MKTYLRKPIQVQAVQWNGMNFDEIQNLCQDAFIQDGKLMISSGIECNLGSYVMKNASGYVNICSKAEFEEQFIEENGRHYACLGSFY